MTTTATAKHQAVVIDGHGGIRLETVSLRRPGPGEVQLDLVASGVCHTDLDSLGWGENSLWGTKVPESSDRSAKVNSQ